MPNKEAFETAEEAAAALSLKSDSSSGGTPMAPTTARAAPSVADGHPMRQLAHELLGTAPDPELLPRWSAATTSLAATTPGGRSEASSAAGTRATPGTAPGTRATPFGSGAARTPPAPLYRSHPGAEPEVLQELVPKGSRSVTRTRSASHRAGASDGARDGARDGVLLTKRSEAYNGVVTTRLTHPMSREERLEALSFSAEQRPFTVVLREWRPATRQPPSRPAQQPQLPHRRTPDDDVTVSTASARAAVAPAVTASAPKLPFRAPAASGGHRKAPLRTSASVAAMGKFSAFLHGHGTPQRFPAGRLAMLGLNANAGQIGVLLAQPSRRHHMRAVPVGLEPNTPLMERPNFREAAWAVGNVVRNGPFTRH